MSNTAYAYAVEIDGQVSFPVCETQDDASKAIKKIVRARLKDGKPIPALRPVAVKIEIA